MRAGKCLTAVLLLVLEISTFAQEADSLSRQEADSLSRRERIHERLEEVHEEVQEKSRKYRLITDDEQFRWQKLILPGALVTVGAFGVENGWYRVTINDSSRDYAEVLRKGRYIHVDDYIQYLPVASNLALELVAEPRHGFKERLCVTATAYATMGILVNGLKYTVKEMRPDETTRNSFPSGHTATAFMGAELVRREYGGWWGGGAYTVATATALLRVYNNRHWTNDLVAGAAIGILSANVGYWLLPWERRLFRLDKDEAVALAAVPFATSRSGGLTVSLVF